MTHALVATTKHTKHKVPWIKAASTSVLLRMASKRGV